MRRLRCRATSFLSGHGVETSDSDAPPLPGNEPKTWSETANVEADAIKERVKFLDRPQYRGL